MKNSIFLDRLQVSEHLRVAQTGAAGQHNECPNFDFWDPGLSIAQLYKHFTEPNESPPVFSGPTHEELVFWRDIATPQWQTIVLRSRIIPEPPHRNDVDILKPARVIVTAAILYWKHTGEYLFPENQQVLTGSWANNGRNLVLLSFTPETGIDVVIGTWPKGKEVIALG